MSRVPRRGCGAAMCLIMLLTGLLGTGPAATQTRLLLPADLALTDHTGAPFTPRDTRGKVVLLAFGYTHCPDVCPMTLSVMAQTMRTLGTDADRVAPLFVSLDPARDAAPLLAQYVRYFHPAIVGLTGTERELKRLTSSLSTDFDVRGDLAGDRYTLDHTANLYLIDASGQVASIVPFGLPPAFLHDRVLALINGQDDDE